MIPKFIIDEIMNTARIEEVVGDFVSLKKSGADYKALSPFTNEKSPSFFVSPNKQIFKDFSSGKGGNVVTFLMEHEQFSYPEALRYLAKKYQINIPEEKEATAEELAAAGERESLLVVLKFAAEYYKNLLFHDETGRSNGLSYFMERKFSLATIEKFGLGYAKTEWNALLQEATKLGYKEKYLALAGLIKTNDSGQTYDMFRGRVIFPIHDIGGKIIAFAARQLNKDDKGPKYLNSPESLVYHKSELLYGLYFAKNGIRLNDKCFLVEGYTDVITLHQAGIENVVASSGTSLTEGQIRQIKRFTENVTVLYDGDPAGLKASQRGIDLILQQGLNVRLVVFPDAEDPDSYCKRVGGEAFKVFVAENEQDFILFKSNLLLSQTGNDPIKKIEAIKSIVDSISLIPEPLKRSVFALECAKIMQVSEQVIQAELAKARKKEIDAEYRKTTAVSTETAAEELQHDETNEEERVQTGTDFLKDIESAIMHNLIQFGHLIYEEEKPVIEFIFEELAEGFDLQTPQFAKMLSEARDDFQNGVYTDERYFIHHTDSEVNTLAANALSKNHKISEDWLNKHEIKFLNEEENFRSALTQNILYYKIRRLEQYIAQNQETLKNLCEKQPESDESKETLDAEVDALLQQDAYLKESLRKLTDLNGLIVLR